jgi:hypothetical protein
MMKTQNITGREHPGLFWFRNQSALSAFGEAISTENRQLSTMIPLHS